MRTPNRPGLSTHLPWQGCTKADMMRLRNICPARRHVSAEEHEKDWKLKLRYGKLTTPFHHYTVVAEGVVGQLAEGFSCPAGSAFMAMKAWASSTDESADMVTVIGRQIGFTVTGRIQIYDTEPVEPPRERPFGYDIQFTTFDPDAA